MERSWSPPSPTTTSASAAFARRRLTVAYFLAFVGLGLTTASMGPTLSAMAAHTRSGLGQASWLFTARWLGYLMGSLLGGRLYDRLRGHPVMVGALLLMAGTLALAPGISRLWVLAGVLLVLGVAEGTLDVGGNTLLVWVHGRQVGPYMNGLHFAFGVGALLSPLIIAQLLRAETDFSWPYWAITLLLLPIAVWVARLPSPTMGGQVEQTPGVTRPNYVLLGLFVLFFFICEGTAAGFPGWVSSYAQELGLADATAAAYLTSGYWGAFTLGRLLGIPISARVRPRYILLADLLGGLFALSVIVAWPHSLEAVWIGSVLLGLALASQFPTGIILAERRMVITGQVTGMFFVGASVGNMLFPLLFGQLFEAYGPPAIMQAMAVELLAALVVLLALVRATHPSLPAAQQ